MPIIQRIAVLALSSSLLCACAALPSRAAAETPRATVHVTVTEYNPTTHALRPVKVSVESLATYERAVAPAERSNAALSYAVFRASLCAPLTRAERYAMLKDHRLVLSRLWRRNPTYSASLPTRTDVSVSRASGIRPDPHRS